MYFSLVNLRFTFKVGVSSPVSCEKSAGKSENFLIDEWDGSFALS